MRYTTLIDLREWPKLYRSASVRLVYLHLVLASGYHDNNRDRIDISIRRLMIDTGLSMGAVRHAIKQLEAAKLVKHKDSAYMVAKWLPERKPTPRTQSNKATDADHYGRIMAEQSQAALSRSQAKSGLDQLKEAAAAGDQNAQRILKERFKL